MLTGTVVIAHEAGAQIPLTKIEGLRAGIVFLDHQRHVAVRHRIAQCPQKQATDSQVDKAGYVPPPVDSAKPPPKKK